MADKNPYIEAVWGKLGQGVYPTDAHPLLAHLIDVGAMACELWQAMGLAQRNRIADGFSLPLADAEPWAVFLIAAHDIGKATPGFQFRENTSALEIAMVRSGYSTGEKKPHAEVSVPILITWLTAKNTDRMQARRLSNAVGGHHGTFASSEDIDKFVGNTKWRELQAAILDLLATIFDVPATVPKAPVGNDQSYLLLLAGLTTTADWLASNEKWFPKASPFSDDYFALAQQRAKAALRDVRWKSSHVDPRPLLPFADVFEYRLKSNAPRPLQTCIEALVAELDGPALVLIEAPMGEGKTEAALYVAEWWRKKSGSGAYIAMPTMATSNGMFPRVEEFLHKTIPDWTQLHLLHGRALLSDDYQRLQDAEIYDLDSNPGSVVADGWFSAQKKQAILAPFGVGTIDQALLAVLQTKHFFLRLFGLAGRTILLDEVHAYDTYMSTLLELLLKWLAALGCPVVLLSATLPKARRLALLRAYAGEGAAEPEQAKYPRITWGASAGALHSVSVEADKSRNRTLELERIGEAELANELRQSLDRGGCVCVIRNTVGLAQMTHRRLKAEFPKVEVLLFHARFLFKDRDRIEKSVLDRFGPQSASRPERCILVATQVVEQSLDLDFDLMVSDVAPIDLLLQRSGRLHRHAGRVRPAGTNAPRLLLIEPDRRDDGTPDFGPSEFVYDRYVLLRTLEVLNGKTELAIPDEIDSLVESAYEDRVETGHDLIAALAEKLKGEVAQRDYARSFLVQQPVSKRHFFEFGNAQLGEDDDPRTAESRRAATRDVRPTVQLVISYWKDGIDYLDPGCTNRMMVDRLPTLAQAKEVIGNSASVSRIGCVYHYAFKEPPKGWAKSGLLRYNRLVRIDVNGRSLVPEEFPMTVDPESGIHFTLEPLED